MKTYHSILLGLFTLTYALPALAQDFVVSGCEFNTPYPEYAPAVVEDGIVFCSERKKEVMVTIVDENDHHPTGIYFSKKDDKGFGKKASCWTESATSVLHDGPACFTSDQKTMYFTGNLDRNGFKARKNHLGIFMCEKTTEGWSTPVPFAYNSEDASFDVAHPHVSPDGSRMFFASNQPGGKGGSDLYMCNKTEKGWSKPVNVGSAINSSGNEYFPHFSADGKLFFSAESADGDLDIFYSRWDEEQGWNMPVRMAEPINSTANDYSIILEPGGESGYFSSDRVGNGDILKFYFAYPKFDGCGENYKPEFCYYLEDSKIVPNDTLPFRYYWDCGDGTTIEYLQGEHCFPGYGKYDVALHVEDTITGMTYAKVSEGTLWIEKPTNPYISCPDTVKVDEIFQLTASESELENFPLDEYYWDFGDGTHTKGTDVEHSYAIGGMQQIILGAVSIPGEYGPMKKCVYKNIWVQDDQNWEPMVAESGAETLVAINGEAMAESDTDDFSEEEMTPLYYVEIQQSEDQIALNDPYFEKVAYEITERYNRTDSLYRYSVGEAREFQALYAIYQEMLDSGYNRSMVLERGQLQFEDEITRQGTYMSDSVRQEMNRQINAFADIQFGNNSHSIEEESYENLNYILSVMRQEPAINLMIRAHTDNVGDPRSNLELSERRAFSVKEYLASQGIDHERLMTIGLGSSEPKATNATAAGRAINRRVEFEVLVFKNLKDVPVVEVENEFDD